MVLEEGLKREGGGVGSGEGAEPNTFLGLKVNWAKTSTIIGLVSNWPFNQPIPGLSTSSAGSCRLHHKANRKKRGNDSLLHRKWSLLRERDVMKCYL